MEQTQQQKAPAQTPAPAPKKNYDEIIVKILFGAGFLALVAGLFLLLKMLPFCKTQCINSLSILEFACVPIFLFLAFLLAGVCYNKIKKIPEKRVEMTSPKEVPAEVLVKVLLASYTVSLAIFAIPGLIFSAAYQGTCGDAEYSGCGSGVTVPFFVFLFPLGAIGAVLGGYFISYRLFVPLSEVGRFPNGKVIMKRTTPLKIRWMTIGCSFLAVVMILILMITMMNSLKG